MVQLRCINTIFFRPSTSMWFSVTIDIYTDAEVSNLLSINQHCDRTVISDLFTFPWIKMAAIKWPVHALRMLCQLFIRCIFDFIVFESLMDAG